MGSVAPTEFLKELPELAKLISAGHFIVETEAVPLADVSEDWQREPDKRLVFTM
ncbi:zinc-containing alcohol dehydrogenase [Secundilactobacillus oryzae JCM 18671]|uniref:Zinc-containing alcohol dehydrogenase n=2 Tax=Secundilactobacillus oryzae TaxID=1202668 RepID=A0A081BHK2_9LACO|nr:zinc-containing alcohol dehydrogenase [Secundilactobacillus oryzae JCM 18671]